MAGELENRQPEAFTAFLRVEAEERERLMKSPLADRPLFQEAITNFDAVERRADRLIKFCNEQGRQYNLSLLDFWQWDERHNPQRFSD
ncbi:MAG: hypothetical protein JOZ57_06970 [Abitibacteriaceae bacterium]|nr:hypothetical protein [Abditibacteriaceae bacterium]